MSRLGDIGHALYAGDISYDFVGRRKRWYAISAIILVVSILSLAVRGLNLGVEFEGGDVVTVPTATGTVEQAQSVAATIGVQDATVEVLTAPSGRLLQVTTPTLSATDSTKLVDGLAGEFNVANDQITVQETSASWGSEITKKGLVGLGVFLVLIALFLTLYFEWRMALSALIALVHDLVITVGIYSLVGFTVTPATLIGVLTILGYSLYDTVVVFDKVRENTRGIAGSNRMTYSSAANLAVNQTLVRSINTSVVALLPVAAILFIGPLLGAGTLKDLSLALFVGIAAGTYSSIFVATPVLCQLKEREPAMQALAKRVAAREAAGKSATTGAAARGGSRRGARGAAAVDEVVAVDEASDDELEPAAGTGSGAGSTPAQPTRSGQPGQSGQRQQPRRPSSAGGRRRPAGKKRR
jgi:preprotein translocase subunit SecF